MSGEQLSGDNQQVHIIKIKIGQIWALLTSIFLTLISCAGQDNFTAEKLNTKEDSSDKLMPYFDPKATFIYQDGNGNYWFGSQEYGVYKYTMVTL